MSEEELKYPEWQKPLQDLILEFDRKRLLEKVKKPEAFGATHRKLAHGNEGNYIRSCK